MRESIYLCNVLFKYNVGQPPPGHGGEGPTLGHFHFSHFFFSKMRRYVILQRNRGYVSL